MKKTIWIINQFAGTPESGWGERHYYLSKYWKNSGYDVKIISGAYNHMFKRTVDVKKLYRHENYKGVDFFWVKTPKYKPRSLRRFYSMLIFMLRILLLPINKIGRPNYIIVSSMPIFPILPGLILKRRYKARLFFEIRDIWPLSLQLLGNKSKNHPAIKFIGWFEKIGYRRSDVIVSLLPNAKEHFEKVARKNIEFEYIPNGIDEDQIEHECLDESIIMKIPQKKFIVGYAGTIGLANAMEYLIDASIELKENKNIHFLIVGEGYLKEKFIASTHGNNNITFIDKVPKSQVQSILSFFDICFISRYDSPLYKHGVSYNKYFDYMLAKKPILESSAMIKDQVELSGCGIIVKPESSEAIINGILTLYGLGKKELDLMGEKGYNYVKKYHNIEYLSKKYLNLFENRSVE